MKDMKKSKLKRILKKAVDEKAFEKLTVLKNGHSKVMNLKYSKLKMQN